ncbi:hypothetical protein ACJ41O_006896 [Fusarium nematophilum]
MHFNAAILGALLAAPALADFSVFCGFESDWTGFDQMDAMELMLFNNPPSCNDRDGTMGYIRNPNNDATQSGFSCDGCKTGQKGTDWDVTRFELPHSLEYTEDTGSHLTIYRGDDGSYGLYNADMESWGYCERPSDPQFLECEGPTTSSGLWHIFECYTLAMIPDSN